MRGFTLIEIIIGIALTLIIFTGIFGAYQLGIKVLGQSKARIGAIALIDEQIETIRNLAYADVGTYSCKSGYPNCDLLQPSQIIQGYPFGKIKNEYQKTLNNISYTITSQIDYVVDDYDGVASPADSCPNDYKKVKIVVSWSGRFSGQTNVDTIISPKNFSQECAETGGILKVTVFDAGGQFVSLPEIKVININTFLEKTAMPDNGVAYITLPPGVSAYKIEVTKTGYSSERTYAMGEVYNSQIIATPDKPHATIIEGELIETSFSIDKLSTLVVNSHAEASVSSFVDSFFDSSKIVESSNIVLNGGAARLAMEDETHYYATGYLISQTIEPIGLLSWKELNYTDDTPASTQIRYQVLYFDGSSWVLVPNADLPGNSAGLQHPPIDLDRLGKDDYPKIRLKATFYSQGARRSTPALFDWNASWFGSGTTIINSVAFSLQGQKIVGRTASSQLIYKYSEDKQTSGGTITIPNMEWDVYSFLVDAVETGLTLTRVEPAQPVNLSPDSSQNVDLFLTADNSLLVLVQNSGDHSPIFSASTRLYNIGLSFDQTLNTDPSGQVFFAPLSAASYTLVVSANNYQTSTSTVSVSGGTNTTINLVPQ